MLLNEESGSPPKAFATSPYPRLVARASASVGNVEASDESRNQLPKASSLHVVQLYEALRKVAWRHGFFAPERIKHHIGEDGRHRIEPVLPGDEVEHWAPSFAKAKSPGVRTPSTKK